MEMDKHKQIELFVCRCVVRTTLHCNNVIVVIPFHYYYYYCIGIETRVSIKSLALSIWDIRIIWSLPLFPMTNVCFSYFYYLILCTTIDWNILKHWIVVNLPRLLVHYDRDRLLVFFFCCVIFHSSFGVRSMVDTARSVLAHTHTHADTFCTHSWPFAT